MKERSENRNPSGLQPGTDKRFEDVVFSSKLDLQDTGLLENQEIFEEETVENNFYSLSGDDFTRYYSHPPYSLKQNGHTKKRRIETPSLK